MATVSGNFDRLNFFWSLTGDWRSLISSITFYSTLFCQPLLVVKIAQGYQESRISVFPPQFFLLRNMACIWKSSHNFYLKLFSFYLVILFMSISRILLLYKNIISKIALFIVCESHFQYFNSTKCLFKKVGGKKGTIQKAFGRISDVWGHLDFW